MQAWPAGFDQPLVLLGLCGLALLLLAFLLLRALSPLTHRLHMLDARLAALSDSHQALSGGLTQLGQTQTQVIGLVESRLADMGRYMGDTLAHNATTTAGTMGALRERLAVIDAAQAKIEALSGNVLSLQDILSNRQARGAFGEVQMEALLSDVLPPDAFQLQATLSNGRRADALIRMPQPIAVDAKFPLDAWLALTRARDDAGRLAARRALAQALRGHVRAIADRYILPGETADSALMFLPSEAVYAELHANLPELVREAFALRVWIVSPTTLMATLTTLRAVMKDARLRSEAQKVQREVQLLVQDTERLVARAAKLDSHFAQAQGDLSDIRISGDKIVRRSARLKDFDFGQEDTDGGPETAYQRTEPRQF